MVARVTFHVFAFIAAFLCTANADMYMFTTMLNTASQFKENVEPTDVSTNVSQTSEIEKKNDTNCILVKHESYCNCSERIGLMPEDYILANDEVHITVLNKTYNDSFYEFRDGTLLMCLSEFETGPSETEEEISDTVLYYITVIGVGISIIGLLFHLFYFAVVPKTRNFPGYCLSSLCASMLIGYLAFLVGDAEGIKSCRTACVAAASISYFFVLSSILWMNVLAFDIYITLFRATSNLMRPQTKFKFKKFLMFSGYSWGISFTFVSAALISDNVDGVPIAYQPLFAWEACWFNQLHSLWIFFIGPVFAITAINALMFCLSASIIYRNRMKEHFTRRNEIKAYFLTCLKLALIMGILWISGILARITDHIVLWYIFAVANTLHGFFISLAFTSISDIKTFIFGRFNIKVTEPSKVPSDKTTDMSLKDGALSPCVTA